MSTITMEFEDNLQHRFASLREFVAHRAFVVAKPMKAQAADMDLSPSTLSRKLNPGDGDTQRLNLDDLEAWLHSTGDAAAVVGYLASKYLDSNEHKQQVLIQTVEQRLADLTLLLPALKASQPPAPSSMPTPLRRAS
jgi:hypothetical protein